MNDMTFHPLQDAMILSDRQSAVMEDVYAEMKRLNAAIRAAVDAGLSVELFRSKRYHSGEGCWGDVMRPVVVKHRSPRRLPHVATSA
jgi:hypothetical protein